LSDQHPVLFSVVAPPQRWDKDLYAKNWPEMFVSGSSSLQKSHQILLIRRNYSNNNKLYAMNLIQARRSIVGLSPLMACFGVAAWLLTLGY
jgi:hypothetical protein